MKYLYLDESYYESEDGYSHVAVGGAFIEPEKVNEITYKINTILCTTLTKNGIRPHPPELHFNNFLQGYNDEDKLNSLKAIVQEVKSQDVKFIISYGTFSKEKIVDFLPFHDNKAQSFVHYYTFFNIPNFIQNYSKDFLIQMIVDAGFNESYLKLYKLYLNFTLGAEGSRLAYGDDVELIAFPNYKNILPPVFASSSNDRLVQISDIIVGAYMLKKKKQISDFKNKLIEIVNELCAQVEVFEIIGDDLKRN